MPKTVTEKLKALEALGPIVRDACYPLPVFKALTGLDAWALRQAVRAGLKIIPVGRRRYIMGADWLAYVEKVEV